MKMIKLFFALILAIAVPRFVMASITGPYTPDANTLFLYHFDEPGPSVVTTNLGSKGGNSYSINEIPGSTTPPTVTGVLGNTGYSSGSINFSNCANFTVSGYEFGYDFNNSGAYQGDNGSGSLSADALLLTNLNIGFQTQTPFTLEALIAPNYITSTTNQEIICTDNSSGSARGFQFRITTGGQLQFSTINPSAQSVSAAIPTTGAHAFVAGAWYHVAVTYDGTNLRLYWTKLDPSVTADNLIGGPSAAAIGTGFGAISSPLIFGNENRNVAGEQFGGRIDEIRISSVARAANQMQFFSPFVTISQNPVSQNVDYNQSVTFSSSATSLTALGYQWRFNSNSIAGATNTGYVIPNVAAANAGYYDVVVTNTAGFSATSSPALLVVGAANFLAHRYSFTNDDTDSIAGANGANFGNAAVTGGALVLDGTTGTYMQLPGGLLNGLQSATVEFWADFGTSGNNDRVFDFGNTNGVRLGVPGQPNNYVFFSPHSGGGTHALTLTSGDNTFEQSTAGSGTLDGRNVHVACVIDPPNKFLAIYTNGVLESANTNMTVGLSSVNGLISYVGRSLYADLNGDAYLNGSIDELRIYNGALGVLSIKQSDDQGPNTVLADGPAKLVLQPANTSVPVGQSATFAAAAVGYLPITYQWFKNGTPITGATNSTLSFATVIGDNGAGIFCNVTNTIGVTTYVTNSATATLTVFLPPTLAWLDAADGGADNLWNTTSLNWTNDVNGGGVVAFTQTNGVLFDNRGSGSPNVDIPQPVTVYSVTVNAASDYAFASSSGQGALNGQAALNKSNSGRLTIDLTNSLSGPVTISGGTLQVGNNDALGSLGSGPVTNNATLSISRGDATLNVANAIRGTGTVSFDGNGAVTVTGNNTYSGNTLVNAGIVFLASPTGFGATNVGTAVASGGQVYITANVNIGEGLTLNGAGDGNAPCARVPRV